MLNVDSVQTSSLDSERDVVSQIKLAFANPLPLLIGALIGALVPIATYTVGHAELGAAGWASVPGAIVIGGCVFSAITVYKWGRRAFDSALKALGFVVLSEGVMTFSQTPWLSMLMLSFLVAINAVANGANLAVAHLDAQRLRAEAAALLAPAVVPVLDAVVPAISVPVVVPAPVVAVAVAAPSLATLDVALDAAPTEKPARKRASKVKVVSKKARATGRMAVGDLN